MFRFELTIRNPLYIGEFKNFYCKEEEITSTDNKCYSFELLYFPEVLFQVEVDINWRGMDHAGPSMMVVFCGFAVSAKLYDRRHWDNENDCWKIYD